MERAGRKARCLHVAARAFHTDIPEPVERKVRHYGLPCHIPTVDVSVCASGSAQIFRIEISVFIQCLRMADDQPVPCQFRQFYFYQPRHVLAEIKNNLSFGRHDLLFWGKPPGHTDRLGFLCCDMAGFLRLIKEDRISRFLLLCRIVLGFSVVDL